MRFDRLDLIRYGALTGRSLPFRPDARLHLIYGPNEAGKSSALSAISDLLFGFPRATAHYSFLHEATSLRIGAAISGRDGGKLEFRRRRGNKDTLRSADDLEAVLAEDALSPYLGNLSRDVFERAFGLDTLRLRQGADDMLKSGGEIGSLLFSAASGLVGLTRLRQSIEAEADAIYAPRRSKDRTFYQALDRQKAALGLEQLNALRSGDWKKLVAEAATLEAELKALQTSRHDTMQSLDRLRRLKTLQPLLVEIDGEQAALEGFADLAGLPERFERQLADTLAAQRAGDEALRAVQAEVTRVREDLEAAHVEGAILDASGAIMSSYADKGSYLGMRRDLPAVKREVEDFELKLVQLSRKLGLPDDAAEIERRQPQEAVLVRLEIMLREGRELARAGGDVRARLEEERRQLRRVDGATGIDRRIDPKPHADRLSALQPDIASLARIDELQVRVSRLRADLGDAVARLSPAVSDLDRILAVPLPDIAMVNEHRVLIEEAEATVRTATAGVYTLERESADVARDLAVLEGVGTIVSRQDVLSARALRDRILRDIETEPPAGLAGRLAALDRAVHDADRLADEAHGNAERASLHTQLTLKFSDLERRLTGARGDRDAVQLALSSAQAVFATLFDTAGIRPDRPERMVEWRRGVESLAKQRDVLQGLEAELAALRLAEDRVRPALAALADATGFSGAGLLPPSALARALQRHISEISDRWTDSRAAEGKRTSIVEALDALEEQLAGLQSDTERWQAEFAGSAAAVGLPDGSSIEMAEAALSLWKAVPATLFERENRHRRVRGMQREIALFEDKICNLVAAVAPDLVSQPVEVVIDQLHRRAVAANAAQQNRQTLAAALERAQNRLSLRKSEAGKAHATLARLLEEVPDARDPDLLLQRLHERRDLEVRLCACRSRFQQQAEGASESDIREPLNDFDRVAADLEIERLTGEEARQVARYGELTAASAENQRRREALETGVTAEYAALERLSAEQEAKDLARQWVVLKLAAHMLNSSMAAYRERQTDPVMARAGAIFSVLTAGRFSRLVEDYDGNDVLQLVAERNGGERVPFDGLSEGTGDQLYLALRLAFLEDYSSRNEPAPMIVDDIFQTFDDDRTAAGLMALAGTCGRFQTILFTHEASVVEIARHEIGKSLDLIHL
jgi:uncharacterized protein YhaN